MFFNRKEKQELHCHECNKYVQFETDMSLNGNHVLNCPNCGHEHCRVVKNGIITGDRWDSRNNNHPVSASSTTFSGTSTFNTYSGGTSGGSFLYESWLNTTSSG